MKVGSIVHAEVEYYLEHREWCARTRHTPEQSVARAGQTYLDKLLHDANGTGQIELTVKRPVGQFALPVYCKVDWYDQRPAVVDHKTTSNINGSFHLTAATMAKDPQLLFYAGMVFAYLRPPTVSIGHIYYQTFVKDRPAASRELHVDVTWEVIEENLELFREISEQMLTLSCIPEKSAKHVPYDTDACYKYHSLCPHHARCPHSPTNKSRLAQQQAMDELLAKYK